MAVEIRLSELLPSLFDRAVQTLSGKSLLPAEKEAVLTGVTNSVQWSVLRRARGSENGERVFKVESLETTDRFGSNWMSRSEIVNRLSVSSGLDAPLAALSLFLIEMRIDQFLMTRQEVTVAGVGTVAATKEYQENSFRSYDLRYEFDRRYSVVIRGLSNEGRAFTWHAAYRRARSAMEGLLNWVEIAEAFGGTVPYNITLAPHLVFIRGERTQPERADLPEGSKHLFIWKGEDGAPEGDAGALGAT
jgi:hypothetical protein